MSADPSGFPLPEGARVSRVDCGAGATLQVVEMGPADGKLVVLAHGFPECWYSWRHQLPALAAAGYRAVAPNLRGYPGSDKPRGAGAYVVGKLAADLVGLARALGAKECALAGNDWGGPPCWEAARNAPELVKKLVLMNTVASMRVFALYMRRSPTQWARFWYMGLFQLPFVAERFMIANGGAVVARSLAYGGAKTRVNTREDCVRYARAFLEPGVATGAINYYRAAARAPRSLLRQRGKVSAPTLVLWGDADPYVEPGFADRELLMHAFSGPLEIAHLDGVGHWIQQQAPEEVNRRLVEFLRA